MTRLCDGADTVELEIHRTLPPVLEQLKADGFQLVGLEQTTGAESLPDFQFVRKTALVVGNERMGMTEEELAIVERVVEIPVFGRPFAYNVHTAVAMAVYEYCRQYPARVRLFKGDLARDSGAIYALGFWGCGS